MNYNEPLPDLDQEEFAQEQFRAFQTRGVERLFAVWNARPDKFRGTPDGMWDARQRYAALMTKG